ncbi:uncharacterized protein PADG_08653 [Paracoccidioides brasiliensis Pb18]|uniref:SRP54-type proteins GTP-binding domain-containing protein n=1 Tax=Paracoccidioides brasiliensis (strain Pb18) TaxID=502780 RepID=C1GMZ3_PARBD|nr:uncharacterized protein PADG_08653 [Paracoccidioides brasiliensis Pb18]EEH44995.2 hypothetical protein PADG_08653 [Paracoccidioides brasiliensis Pb18]
MAGIIDDKSQYCLPFLLEQLKLHGQRHAHDSNPPPFFVGLNGVQGVGKTVLVAILRSTLSSPPYNLPTIAFSLDDIYLNHTDQLRLAASHPSNPLLQHRGQPSTHDIPLGKWIFSSLRRGLPTKIPAYDKSAFNGQGDRIPESRWEIVNDVSAGQRPVKVVIFEGWCVGFRARPEEEIRKVWEYAVQQCKQDLVGYRGRLGYVRFEDVKVINDALRGYDAFTDDAEDTHFVYDWRQEQEQNLIAVKGSGMTVEQVNKFVDGYYPSYELFTKTLRKGVFAPRQESGQPESSDDSWRGRQLRLIDTGARGEASEYQPEIFTLIVDTEDFSVE